MATTLSIGRSTACDVVIADPTVSRRHAELTALDAGAFLFVDGASTSGSFRMEAGDWVRIKEARLAGGDRLRLGEFETTVGELVARAGRPAPSRRGRVVERDPATGRIMVRDL